MKKSDVIVLSSPRYESLAKKVAKSGGWKLGTIARNTFEGGDPHLVLSPREIQHKHVVIIGGTIDAIEKDDIFRLSHTAFLNEALQLTIVVPYYGTQRQERITKPGEHCPAKLEAIEFSHLPRPAGGMKILLVDLHLEQIVNYFENNQRAIAVQCKEENVRAIRKIAHELYGDNWELMGADQGILKWVQSLGDLVGKDAGCCLKRRVNGEAILYGLMGEVRGRNIIMFDDMLFTGSTAMKGAKLMKKRGAKGISIVCSHGVLPGDSLEKIRASKLFDRIITLDTHPNAVRLASECQDGFYTVQSSAALLAERIVNPWWTG